jgi:hypothetical protein
MEKGEIAMPVYKVTFKRNAIESGDVFVAAKDEDEAEAEATKRLANGQEDPIWETIEWDDEAVFSGIVEYHLPKETV